MNNKDLERLLELETEMNKLILLIQKSTGKEQIQYDTQLTKLALEAQSLKSQIESKLQDNDNYIGFNETVKPHKFLKEGKEDDCQVCGYPERFHQKEIQELSQLRPIVKRLEMIQNLDLVYGIYFADKRDFRRMLFWVYGAENNLSWASPEVKQKIEEILASSEVKQ